MCVKWICKKELWSWKEFWFILKYWGRTTIHLCIHVMENPLSDLHKVCCVNTFCKKCFQIYKESGSICLKEWTMNGHLNRYLVWCVRIKELDTDALDRGKDHSTRSKVMKSHILDLKFMWRRYQQTHLMLFYRYRALLQNNNFLFLFFLFKILVFFIIVLSHIKISRLKSWWSQEIFYPNVILELWFWKCYIYML